MPHALLVEVRRAQQKPWPCESGVPAVTAGTAGAPKLAVEAPLFDVDWDVLELMVPPKRLVPPRISLETVV